MINQGRNNQVRDRMMNMLFRQMSAGSSQGIHPLHSKTYVRKPVQDTIDIEYEDVTDESRGSKKQIPSSKGEIH